jgi:hypothetical protein
LRGRGGECGALDRLLVDARAGRSGVLALRGEPGAGKSALLEFVVRRARDCRIAQAAGVEPEMELASQGCISCAGRCWITFPARSATRWARRLG